MCMSNHQNLPERHVARILRLSKRLRDPFALRHTVELLRHADSSIDDKKRQLQKQKNLFATLQEEDAQKRRKIREKLKQRERAAEERRLTNMTLFLKNKNKQSELLRDRLRKHSENQKFQAKTYGQKSQQMRKDADQFLSRKLILSSESRSVSSRVDDSVKKRLEKKERDELRRQALIERRHTLQFQGYKKNRKEVLNQKKARLHKMYAHQRDVFSNKKFNQQSFQQQSLQHQLQLETRKQKLLLDQQALKRKLHLKRVEEREKALIARSQKISQIRSKVKSCCQQKNCKSRGLNSIPQIETMSKTLRQRMFLVQERRRTIASEMSKRHEAILQKSRRGGMMREIEKQVVRVYMQVRDSRRGRIESDFD